MKKCRNKRIKQRVISIAVAAALFTNIFPFSGISDLLASYTSITASAAFTPEGMNTWSGNKTYNFQSAHEFMSYCYWYQNNTDFAAFHKDDQISIAMNDTNLDENFLGLGTAANPFEGSVTFASQTSYTMRSYRAFFAYLSDKAEIKGTGSADAFTLVLNRLGDVGDSESAPVLADHVVHNSNVAQAKGWKIQLTGNYTYSGVIGEIGSDAKVKLSFTQSVNKNVAFNEANQTGKLADAGAVCGSMKRGSSLELTYNGSINFSVTSANGNAGGLVGTMENNATLTVMTAPSSFAPNVKAFGSGSDTGNAGGLVGHMSSSASVTMLPSIGGTVEGENGAGGVFGKYAYTSNAELNLNDYNSTATVYGKYCGGLFGVLTTSENLDITSKNSSDSSVTVKSYSVISGTPETNHSEDGYFGGVIGKLTAKLAKTVSLKDLKVSPTSSKAFKGFGGVIGIVDSATYVKVEDLTVSATGAGLSSSATFGGVVGTTSDTKGVFIDLGNFTLTANDFKGGGAVGRFNNGVLRLSGTTDMTNGKPKSAADCGQLVGYNNNVLVYAVGNGSDSNWTFKRSNGSQVDDLGTWGEVVRIPNIEDSSNGILTLNTTAHTVTVKAAQTSMSTPSDFVKTALNIQLNQGSDYDCLQFVKDSNDVVDTSNTRTTLLESTSLSFGADISLAGTGITGFMRDGSDSVGAFTGTLNGNSKTITLAVGEKYGQDSTGTAISSSSTAEGVGQIYRHPYNGLFAVIGNGTSGKGTVKLLTVNGTIDVHNMIDGMNIGGIAAVSMGDTTLNEITANQTINYSEPTAVTGTEAAGKNIGGLIGVANNSTDNGTIAITGKNTISTTINISKNYKNWTCVGAAIGKITSPKFTVNIAQATDDDKLTVSHTMTVASNVSVGANADGGGLIGYITSGTYSDRKVNIKNLDFDNCTIINKASSNGGGFLGYAWLDTKTTIDGLTVTNGTITNSSPNVGVMCYEATGRWTVNDLTVTKMSLSGGAGTSLGMLVNKAYSGNNGLYLDVLKAKYTLKNKSGETGITLPNSLGVYDELAAYSASSKDKVIQGGNGVGVISINMNSARNTGSALITTTGTYQNQISRVASEGVSAIDAAKYPNANSRYYYNLDQMSTFDGGQDLVLWSVKKYAATNISGEFVSSDTPLGSSGSSAAISADLTGLSFYPIAKADGNTIGNLALTFDYSGIYSTAESVSNDTYNIADGYIRDPGASNQHYLMHSGLFINLSAGSTLTVSGAMSLSGNFLEVDKYKGVLISDMMRGTFDSSEGSISLNGITPRKGASAYTDGYLLINNIKRNASDAAASLKMYNVSTGEGYTGNTTTSTTTVAKSLIGAADGPGLNIEFKAIKLDGRKSNSITSASPEQITALDTAYNTKNSIFTDSTLLASIKTDQNAQLVYNYKLSEDWDSLTSRKVTYGYEVSGSVEYQNKEKKYLGSSTFTNPLAQDDGEYTFSDFRPYVKTKFTAVSTTSLYFRELKVNVVAAGLTVGCGTYNDPYIISENDQLINVAKFLNTAKSTDLGSVTLPKAIPSSFTSGDRWCTDKSGDGYHVTYVLSGETYTIPEGAATWNNAQIQQWLAGAYYKVTGNVTLNNTFVGLGGTTANTAFRGVIVGQPTTTEDEGVTTTTYPTITNNSANPFINVANGCVIKDVIVQVGISVPRTQDNNTTSTAYFDYKYTEDSVCKFYGGIIGEIMGGDNIIDNSYVKFGNNTVTLSGDAATIVPVGGYVGVVVFGGLIFKNMDASKTTLTSTGLKVYYYDGTTTDSDNNLAANTTAAKAAIYVNPLVGRVINGYAVNETGGNAKNLTGATVNQFSNSEDGKYHDDEGRTRTDAVEHTLKNGKKHYPIADITRSLGKLDVTKVAGASEDGNINVPNAQALFVLSLITQSAAGTATDAALGAYDRSLSYGTYDGNVYGMSHNADYSDVGTDIALVYDDQDTEDVDESNLTDYQKLARLDTANNSNGNAPIPYIIKYYTEGSTTTGTSTRTETRTRTNTREVFNYETTYSETRFTTLADLDGEVLVIKGRANATYLTSVVRTNPDDRRNTVLGSSTDLKDAVEIHFEKQTNGKYYLWCGTVDDKMYLKMTALTIKDKVTTLNNSRANLELSSDPFEFDIYYNSANGGYFTISCQITANDNQTRTIYINCDNNASRLYYCGYTQGSGNPGTNNFDNGNRLNFYERSSTTNRVEPFEEEYEEEYEVTITEYSTTHNYSARCVTSSAGYYDISLTGSGTYMLPDSFRGLGCVGNANDQYMMKVDIFDGAGCTIDEDIYLNKYQSDNYFGVIHSATTQDTSTALAYGVNKEQAHHGIGLFDSIGTSGANSKITDLTVTGSVNTEIYKDGYNDSSQEFTAYANNAANFLSVGGVCGSSNGTATFITFDQINLTSLSVCGSCVVGGLLGYSNNQNDAKVENLVPIIVNKCNASDLSIKMNSTSELSSVEQARNAMGGFVGKCVEGNVQIKGDTSSRSNVAIKSFGYEQLDGVTDHRAVAGGLVGFAGNGCSVENMSVSHSTGYAVEIGSDYTGYAGGLVGLMQPSTSGGTSCVASFINCTVNEINVNGHYAGGFYGGKWFGNNNAYVPYSITLNNCQMVGSTGTNNTINGNSLRNENGYAGGFLGCGNVYTNGSPNIEIKDCKVSKYTITSARETKGYAGGFIGYTGSSANNSSITCYIHDSSVEDCVIGTTGNYAGGAIGQVSRRTTSSVNKILGYNIKLDNVTSNATNKGAWIGWVANDDNTTSIQFTGVGIYGNGFAQNVGNRKNFSNANFVFADYNDKNSLMNETNKKVSDLNKGTTVEMPKYPYVNVNPQSSIGGNKIISSDGAVRNSGAMLDPQYQAYPAWQTMAVKIYSEIGSEGTSQQYYTTFEDDYVYGEDKIGAYMKRSIDSDGDRISTFATERKISLPQGVDDFAVVVIANSRNDETTNLINRYIQLVTNTNTATDYTDYSPYYDIEAITCEYDDGSFTLKPQTTPGLTWTKPETSTDAQTGTVTQINKGSFALNRDYADSIEGTFTLLDVQFKDPFDTTRIAYHLYVPVYTIREMEINFYTAARTGAHSVSYTGNTPSTEYSSLMSADVNHAESINTWMTQYIRYEYQAMDINALLNTGRVKWNYNKSVNFETYLSGGPEEKRLPDGTLMLLVDPNANSDQVYYTTVNTTNLRSYNVTDEQDAQNTRACWAVDLTAFKKDDQSNTAFSVPTINDVISRSIVVTPNTDNKGRYKLLTLSQEQIQNGQYDVYVVKNGVTSYYEFRTSSDGDSDLDVESTVYEDYYISLKVPASVINEANENDIYHYRIVTPDSFSANSISYSGTDPKAKSASITQNNNCSILIADLFEQTNGRMEVQPDIVQIKANNKTLTVNLSTKVVPRNNAAILYLNRDALFHSFYINLIRKSSQGTDSIIRGKPTFTTRYSIDSPLPPLNTEGYTPVSCSNVDLQETYINVQTANENQSSVLIDKLRQNHQFTIYAEIEIEFDDELYTDEFPVRESAQQDYGVSVQAASNLAYDAQTLAYTSMSESFGKDSHSYFIESIKSATLRYSPHTDDRDREDEIGYSSWNQTTLGVNGISADTASPTRTNMPVNTQAFYNVQSLSNVGDAKYIKLSFALEKKTDTGSGTVTGVEYTSLSRMQDYLDGNIVIKSANTQASVEAKGNRVYAILKVEDCSFKGNMFDFDIMFNAKTGRGFTEYANYKVDLQVELFKELEDPEDEDSDVKSESNIENSVAQDYIIYTNAKVNPEFIILQ